MANTHQVLEGVKDYTRDLIGVEFRDVAVDAADRAEGHAIRAETAADNAEVGIRDNTVAKQHLTPGLRDELDGKADRTDIPTTDGGQDNYTAATPPTAWPRGVSAARVNGDDWRDSVYDVYPELNLTTQFIVLTIRGGTLERAAQQYMSSYHDSHQPIWFRKGFSGDVWGPWRSLTDDGHTHTAAQVGARPDTWTPTAQDVGARPDTWTPTAQEVEGLGAALSTTWQQREALFISDEAGSDDGSWVAADQNYVGEGLPSWVTMVSGPSVFLGKGVFEVAAQAQAPSDPSSSTTGGGIVIFGRDGSDWVARSGKTDSELNGASMIFDTRDLGNPRVYSGCYPTDPGVKVNMLIRKLM